MGVQEGEEEFSADTAALLQQEQQEEFSREAALREKLADAVRRTVKAQIRLRRKHGEEKLLSRLVKDCEVACQVVAECLEQGEIQPMQLPRPQPTCSPALGHTADNVPAPVKR